MTDIKNYPGFLLIKKTYAVKCLQCGFRGKAVLGDEPIQTEGVDGPDWCPVCNHTALVSEDYKEPQNGRS